MSKCKYDVDHRPWETLETDDKWVILLSVLLSCLETETESLWWSVLSSWLEWLEICEQKSSKYCNKLPRSIKKSLGKGILECSSVCAARVALKVSIQNPATNVFQIEL